MIKQTSKNILVKLQLSQGLEAKLKFTIAERFFYAQIYKYHRANTENETNRYVNTYL